MTFHFPIIPHEAAKVHSRSVHIEFFLQQLLLPGMNCNIFHLQSESLTCHDAYTGSVKIIPEELT